MATTYWTPHDVQIIDFTNGSVLASVLLGTASGSGILSINDGTNRCVIDGSYYESLQKLNDSDLS